MNTLTIAGHDVRTLFSHLALYGLAAIVEDAGASPTQDSQVRLRWSAGMEPRPCLDTGDLTTHDVARIVHDHAHRHTAQTDWVSADLDLTGKARGLMSPRIAAIGDDRQRWNDLRCSRQDILDTLTAQRGWLDLRLLQALGEPAYWARRRDGGWLQDNGASRLEMQPRNQGSEFVGSRLRKLAHTVAGRDPDRVQAGLTGASVTDEIGKDEPESRTATGLANPGPTDNSLAWCALWGISQFPLASRVGDDSPLPASTSGHLGRSRQEWFYAPVWTKPWTSARLRTVLASRQLQLAASGGLPSPWAVPDPQAAAARAWLAARGVVGLVRFPIARFGSDSAPERRAMRADVLLVSAL